MRWRLVARLALAAGPLCVLGGGGGRYQCAPDEVVGEVQGETGVVCGPRCQDSTFNCPMEVPSGTSAQPQCILQDIDQNPYCGLLCQVDSQCPSGDSCKRSATTGIGVCIRPMSFGEWAMGSQAGSRKKLVVGWPSKAGQSATGFKIAKAYAALQNIKKRYGVADGDADVLTVKELLSAASSLSTASGATAPAPGPSGPWSAQYKGFAEKDFAHDVNYFAQNMENGVPGIQREIKDTVWNLEHIENYGVCMELLRGVLLLGAVYLLGGMVYKNQTMGATGMDMVPHIGFWQEYPALVSDGMKYSADALSEMLGKPPARDSFANSSAGFQPIGAVDRDTFAAFEPIKSSPGEL